MTLRFSSTERSVSQRVGFATKLKGKNACAVTLHDNVIRHDNEIRHDNVIRHDVSINNIYIMQNHRERMHRKTWSKPCNRDDARVEMDNLSTRGVNLEHKRRVALFYLLTRRGTFEVTRRH